MRLARLFLILFFSPFYVLLFHTFGGVSKYVAFHWFSLAFSVDSVTLFLQPILPLDFLNIVHCTCRFTLLSRFIWNPGSVQVLCSVRAMCICTLPCLRLTAYKRHPFWEASPMSLASSWAIWFIFSASFRSLFLSRSLFASFSSLPFPFVSLSVFFVRHKHVMCGIALVYGAERKDTRWTWTSTKLWDKRQQKKTRERRSKREGEGGGDRDRCVYINGKMSGWAYAVIFRKRRLWQEMKREENELNSEKRRKRGRETTDRMTEEQKRGGDGAEDKEPWRKQWSACFVVRYFACSSSSQFRHTMRCPAAFSTVYFRWSSFLLAECGHGNDILYFQLPINSLVAFVAIYWVTAVACVTDWIVWPPSRSAREYAPHEPHEHVWHCVCVCDSTKHC